MDNITTLIKALEDVKAEFTALGQDRAFQGIVLTLSQTFKGRAADFQPLLPQAAMPRVIKNPVQIKSLGNSGIQGSQSTSCPTCGKGSSVPVQQNKPVSGNILRLAKKVEEIATEVFEQPYVETDKDYSQLVSDLVESADMGALPLSMQEATEALGKFSEAINATASAMGLTTQEAAKTLDAITEDGIGISPTYFENPEKILTGEPVIESNDWITVLQEVKDVKQGKELYKAITGKGYPPRWPQELDQIAKAIWQARQNIEI
jgi:hypothetical protein